MGGGVGEVHKPTPTPQDPCTWAREQEEWPGPVKFIAGPGHSTSYIKKVLSGGEGEPCSPLLSPQTPQIGVGGEVPSFDTTPPTRSPRRAALRCPGKGDRPVKFIAGWSPPRGGSGLPKYPRGAPGERVRAGK